MTTNLTVPCEAAVAVTYTAPLTHRCPFVEEVDRGTVTITWATAGATFELHALTAWLDAFERDAVSHEALTDTIRAELADRDGIGAVSVESSWVTAGAEVMVRAVSGEPVHAGGA